MDKNTQEPHGKTKLLIVADTFLPKLDGVMRFISEIAPRLSEDYAVTLLVPDYGIKQVKFQNIPLIKIPITRFQLAGYNAAKPKYFKIKKAVAENDIVFVQSGLPLGLLATIAARKLKKPVVTYVHQIGWEQVATILAKRRWMQKAIRFFLKYVVKYILNKSSALILPSENIAEHLKKKGFHSSMAVVNLGVGEEFVPVKDLSTAKKKLGIEPKYTVLGYTGRISDEKSIDTLHDSFLRLFRDTKNIYLLIVGGGSKEAMEKLKGPHIKLTGFVDDVVPYLQAMDIFVMPSLTETTSLSTLEAMRCGVPVLATPVGHIKEYVHSGYNGYLFPRRNPGILLEKMKVLVNDRTLRKKIGKNARKSIIQKYDWDKTSEKILKVLEEVRSK